MKYINLEEIWQKFPNKYQAIVKIAREVRKINEARKPAIPEPTETTPETAVPEIEPTVVTLSSEPKKRGRRPKKAVEEIKPQLEKESLKEKMSVVIENTESGKKIVAEKEEENPYLVAIKKILK